MQLTARAERKARGLAPTSTSRKEAVSVVGKQKPREALFRFGGVERASSAREGGREAGGPGRARAGASRSGRWRRGWRGRGRG
jgi:hypothetical protein